LHEWPAVREQREKEMNEKQIRAKHSKKYNGPRWSQRKSDDEVSAYVLSKRMEKRIANKILKRVLEMEEEFDREVRQKKLWSEQKMKENQREKLVCVMSDAGDVSRIELSKAKKLVEDGEHAFISKQKYKRIVKINEDGPRPGLNLTDGPSRRQDRQRPPRKASGSMFAKIQHVYDLTNSDGEKVADSVDKRGYLVKDGKVVTDKATFANRSSEAVYEYVQEEKNIWEMEEWTDARGRVKMRPTKLKDVIPKMSLQKDPETGEVS
jgi:hypothetical protein